MEQEPHWILLNKQSEQQIYVKKSRMNVGRCAAADIICYNDNISRNQAYITVDADGDLYVHDNQSVNGTFINCERIDPKKLYKLKMYDEVGFGLHSQVPYGEGQTYIFEVIDLRIKENPTEEKTAMDVEIRQPVVLLTDMNIKVPDMQKKSPNMNEKSPDIRVKLEPLDVSKIYDLAPKTHKGYTIKDSVIVVDDSDESDSEEPFSQLLGERKTNNSQDEPGIGDNTFFEVKKELEDMEQGAEGCVVCIDEEFEHSPVSSHDLLLMLQDSNEHKNQVKKIVPLERSNHTILNERRITVENKTTQKLKEETSAKKYTIPPIISPHFEIPKSRKRKGVTEASSTKNKRTKSTEVTQTKPKFTPKAELRDKLKVVAMKKKSPPVQEKQSIAPAPAKVKVSESRGNFLIKPIEVIPNLAKRTLREKPTTVSPNRIPITFKSTPSTSTASTSAASPSGCGNMGDAITMSHGNFKMAKTHEMLEDILLQVLSWNPTWFNERISNDTLPPINKKPLLKLLNSFTNYAEYYNIVLPHWLVELWYFFCKEFDSHPNRMTKSYKAHLEKCTNNGKFIELKCYGFISKEESDQLSHIREEDLVILDVTFANNKKLRGAYLGSVCNVKKSIVRNNSANRRDLKLVNGMVPYATLDFNILMKTSREIRSFKKIVEVRFFTNMMSTWRIFKSIKHLRYSPLCSHILNPSSKNYRHPSDNINLNGLNLDTKLNYNQKCAVAEATKLCLGSEPGICMIQGPPGTGKSTVIVNIVKQILLTRNSEANQQCILLVAPTNTAIDDLLVKLMDFKSKIEGVDRKKFKIIRFGPPASIGSATKSYSLNEIAKNNLVISCFQKHSNNIELTEMQTKISTLKSQLGQNPRIEAELTMQKSLLEKKCIDLMGRSELNQVEQRILTGAKIICTTLSSCLGTRMEEVFTTNSNKISCCIVDESTNSKEQETFIPLKLGISKLVLIGDPKQLPGVTFAKEAKEYGHGNSLFARLMANFEGARKNPIRFLNIQYRMNPAICSFPNHTYYNGLLKTDPHVIKRNNPICTSLCPYLVFQMENDLTNINQQQEYQNDSETNFILKLVQAIVEILPLQHKINIGIITPYNIQKDSINIILQRHKFGPNLSISVNTVDSFQGQEKDIIILSSVRTFSNNFLADNQRLNVALTRAKYALYVIGTENLFKTCEIFGKLQRNSKNRKLLRCVPSTIDVPHLAKYIKQTRPNK